MQFNGLNENRMMSLQQQQQQDQHSSDYQLPQDQSINSFKDRSHMGINGNFNGVNGFQYRLANNLSLSPTFLNNFANMSNNNNRNNKSNFKTIFAVIFIINYDYYL